MFASSKSQPKCRKKLSSRKKPDGVNEVGVFRKGDVYFDVGKRGYEGEMPFQFGLPGDLPIAGNWASNVDAVMTSIANNPAQPDSKTLLVRQATQDRLELSFSPIRSGVNVEYDPLVRLSDGRSANNRFSCGREPRVPFVTT